MGLYYLCSEFMTSTRMTARGLVGLTPLFPPTVKRVTVLKQSNPRNTQLRFFTMNYSPAKNAHSEVLPEHPLTIPHTVCMPWSAGEK